MRNFVRSLWKSMMGKFRGADKPYRITLTKVERCEYKDGPRKGRPYLVLGFSGFPSVTVVGALPIRSVLGLGLKPGDSMDAIIRRS